MPEDANRVAETATTTGTGTLTLAGAVLGHQTFGTAYGTGGNTDVYYGIVHADNGSWEVGIGTFLGATNQLQRDLVIGSSAGGSNVSFASGNKTVYVPQPAEMTKVIRCRRSTDVGLELRPASGQTADLVAAYSTGGSKTTSLTHAGAFSTGSITTSSNLAVAGNATITGSATVSGGPLTVSAGGATITAGGLTVSAGGATITGGITAATGSITMPDTAALRFGSDNNRIGPSSANGPVQHVINGTVAARTEIAGTTAGQATSIITREKGDARYTLVSSLRYKDDVEVSGRIPGLVDIDPHTWAWGGELAEDDFRRGEQSYGLIAEHVAAVFPDAVALDDQGRPDRLNAGPLFGALLAEIKHLTARVAALEAN